MTLLALLVAVLAAGLTPLLLRDLRRAVTRRRHRAAIRRIGASVRGIIPVMQSLSVATAAAAAQFREFREAFRQGEQR
jgi:hypothetical protein